MHPINQLAHADSVPQVAMVKKRRVYTIEVIGMVLEKEFIVSQVRASQDVSPYVYLSLKDPNAPDRAQGDMNFKAFSIGDMNEMMENLSRVLTQQTPGGFTTILKLTEDEYREMDIKVGDRVTLNIQKTQIGVK